MLMGNDRAVLDEMYRKLKGLLAVNFYLCYTCIEIKEAERDYEIK